MRTLVQNRLVFWRELWLASPAGVAGGLVCVFLAAVASYLVMTGSGQLVAQLAGHAPDGEVWQTVAVTLGAVIVSTGVQVLQQGFASMCQAGSTVRQQQLLAQAALAPHGIEHLEDSDRAAKLRGLTDHVRSDLMLTSVQATWELIGIRTAGLAALAAVAQWSWAAAAGLLVAQLLHARAFTRYLQVVQRDAVENAATDGRRLTYLLSILTTRPYAKEARLFGLTGWILARHEALWQTGVRGVRARRHEALRPALRADVVMIVLNVIVLGLLVADAWYGRASLAVVVTAAGGIAAMSAFGPLGDTSVQVERARTAAREVHDLHVESDHLNEVSPCPGSGHGAASISLRDVSFTYPSRSEAVFENLSLDIPAGQSVAVVGVNGVGKSTLVKLLCGLYRPNAGEIRIGGRDPATDDAARRQVAVIFQDFVRYQLSLAENVALPLLAAGHPDDTFAAQALDLAAGTDVLDQVGDWQRILDPTYDGGTELSGGQWQRVALARALTAVHAGARVLILDEPTAALDVRAEAQIFERFLDVTVGVTSILVSHRLSSVRRAQRIIVLGPSGVIEDGSHDELVAANGVYAQMFALQASRFTEGHDNA